MKTRIVSNLRLPEPLVWTIAIGAWILVGLLAYSQLPMMLSSGLDNDHLTIFDHWALFFDDKLRPWEWVFSRLPSLVPDYILTYILALWLNPGQIGLYIASYWAAKLVIIATLMTLVAIAFSLNQSKSISALCVASACLAAVCVSPGFMYAVMVAGLPVNHGGSVVNSLIALLLLFALCRRTLKMRSLQILLMFVLGALAGFSNRMFLLQLLPAIGIGFWVLRLRCRLWLPLSLGGVTGGAFLYTIVIRQCADPSSGVFATRLIAAKSALSMIWSTGLLPILIISCVAAFLLAMRSGECTEPRALACVYIAVTLFGLITYFLLVPDSEIGYLRYLLLPVSLSPVILAVFFQSIVSSAAGLFSFVLISFVGFLFILAGMSFSYLRLPALDARHSWAVKVLLKLDNQDFPVLAVSPAWQSRSLGLSIGQPGSVLAVSTDGNPMLFPHAREEYLSNRKQRYSPNASHIKEFRYYLGSGDQKDSLLRRLKLSQVPVTCYNDKYCLWRLDDKYISQRKQFFVEFFSTQADDRWRCLNTDSNPFKSIIMKVRSVTRYF